MTRPAPGRRRAQALRGLLAPAPRSPCRRPGAASRPPAVAVTTTRPAGRTHALPSPPPLPAATSSSCGFLDVSCEIGNAITSWFAALARDALRPLLTLAGQTLLSSPQPGAIPAVHSMWATSLAIADSAYVLLVLIGGVIVMGHETLQTSYSAKDIAPRLVTGFLAANLSLVLISRATSIANALSAALAGDGVTPATAASALLGTLTAPLPGGGIFLVLLALAGAVLALVLAVVYVLRLMALVLLTAAAPLALAAYALPQTAWAARWWWRALTACLAIQAAQALVLTAAVRVFSSAGWIPLHGTRSGSVLPVLTAICLLYIMMRIPWWVSRPVLSAFGPSPIRRDRQVRLLRRRPVPRQPPAARRSRGQASRLRRAAAGAAGRPGHAAADPPGQADPRQRQAAGQEPAPAPAPGLAGDSQAPLARAGASQRAPGLAAASRAAPGRSGPAAGRDPAAARAGPGRHRGDLAGAAAPAPGAGPGSRPAPPGPAAASPAARAGSAGLPPARGLPRRRARARRGPASPPCASGVTRVPRSARTSSPAGPGPAAAAAPRPPGQPAVPLPPRPAGRPAAPGRGQPPGPGRRQAPAAPGAARPGR